MALGALAETGYTHKSSRYSSHSILLDSMPADGGGRRVLDLGCATGFLAQILALRNYDVTGIERAGAYGACFPAGVRLVEADLESGLPALNGTFDYIICGDILEHLSDPGAMLRQLGKVLAADGTLVASLPNSGNLYFRLTILMGRFPQEDKGLFDRTHLHFYMWDGWRKLLESSGFGVSERKVTGVPLGLALPRLDGSAAVNALESLAFTLAKIRPSLFAYQFVVTARRRIQDGR